jgi:hypothetical protein
MDTYMARDLCENDMVTNRNNAFLTFNYFDGSKDCDRVASAAVFGQHFYSLRLPFASSIFSSEANAILLAVKFVVSSYKSKFMICSDSLSQSIQMLWILFQQNVAELVKGLFQILLYFVN